MRFTCWSLFPEEAPEAARARGAFVESSMPGEMSDDRAAEKILQPLRNFNSAAAEPVRGDRVAKVKHQRPKA